MTIGTAQKVRALLERADELMIDARWQENSDAHPQAAHQLLRSARVELARYIGEIGAAQRRAA